MSFDEALDTLRREHRILRDELRKSRDEYKDRFNKTHALCRQLELLEEARREVPCPSCTSGVYHLHRKHCPTCRGSGLKYFPLDFKMPLVFPVPPMLSLITVEPKILGIFKNDEPLDELTGKIALARLQLIRGVVHEWIAQDKMGRKQDDLYFIYRGDKPTELCVRADDVVLMRLPMLAEMPGLLNYIKIDPGMLVSTWITRDDGPLGP